MGFDMCGLAGFILTNAAADAESMRQSATAMARSLEHRGPDDLGVWVDASAGIAMGHARLSVVDLSDAGHQPMISTDGRWVLSYNGEIYNASSLRQDLVSAGVRFRGHSDSEVLVEACAAWGPAEAIIRADGMFAFAVWDRQERRLHLVRDRLGIKPLYWGRVDDVFLFGSELKSLRAYPHWTPRIDRDAVAAYMRLGYVPSPCSIYASIQQLEPAEHRQINADQTMTSDAYWSLRQTACDGSAPNDALDETEAVERLDELLKAAVSRRMISDVPVGAFLSGGIDSSMVVALMQSQKSDPVKTFTIGFEDAVHDESAHGAAVADHLKTDHTTWRITAAEAQEMIPRLPDMYDEPFGDSSQIPTHLVSTLARRHVTVALSGDGGDEMFAGYDRHARAEALWQRARRWPRPLRSVVASLAGRLGPSLLGSVGRATGSRRTQTAARRVARAAELIRGEDDGASLTRALVSVWPDPTSMVPGASEPTGVLFDTSLAKQLPSLADRMRLLDALTYLPGDLLTKVDRASMAVSLEVRVPLLDHRIAEFAFGLPRDLLIRQNRGKWILRRALSAYLPEKMFERPKMGFSVPMGRWLRGPLRDWAESLLETTALEADGLLNAAPIRSVWRRHLRGAGGYENQLWTVLMFQAWRQRWMG
jgi:asparagine synthase (glutamine-hydrolysing)